MSARCPYRGCPVRWRNGENRFCGDHNGTLDVSHLLAALDDGDGHQTESLTVTTAEGWPAGAARPSGTATAASDHTTL